MNLILAIGVLVALALGAAAVLVFCTISMTVKSMRHSSRDEMISWKDYPIYRLLDPADFDYLRTRGISEKRLQALRAERRKTLRLCLRTLAHDFDHLHYTLKLLLVQSQEDRPDLIVLLARQRAFFCRNMLRMHAWLFLHACGFNKNPEIDLIGPLRILQAQLETLARPPVAWDAMNA